MTTEQELAIQREREIEAIKAMPRWAIIDGTGLLHRAYHAFKNNTAPDGHSTGVLIGTLNFFHKYLKAMNGPEHAIAVFDAKGGSLERMSLYPEYKKQRPERPEEISKQEPWVHAFLKASGIPVLSVHGVESDDVLAAIAIKESTDKRIGIFSADKDMGSMVRKNILWYRPDNESDTGAIHMTKKLIFDKFGIAPHQFVDYLTLLGDTADNLPGVDKIGKTIAAKLLKEFDSINGIFESMKTSEGPTRLQNILGNKSKLIWTNLQDAEQTIPTIQSLIQLRENTPVPRETYANREVVNDQMMTEMAAEHGIPPYLGYFLPWQQERITNINKAKNIPTKLKI